MQLTVGRSAHRQLFVDTRSCRSVTEQHRSTGGRGFFSRRLQKPLSACSQIRAKHGRLEAGCVNIARPDLPWGNLNCARMKSRNTNAENEVANRKNKSYAKHRTTLLTAQSRWSVCYTITASLATTRLIAVVKSQAHGH